MERLDSSTILMLSNRGTRAFHFKFVDNESADNVGMAVSSFMWLAEIHLFYAAKRTVHFALNTLGLTMSSIYNHVFLRNLTALFHEL